jgi:hypothetical protein
VVTHPTTNSPIQGLCMAERTGCPFLLDLWSYVPENGVNDYIKHCVLELLRFCGLMSGALECGEPENICPKIRVISWKYNNCETFDIRSR